MAAQGGDHQAISTGPVTGPVTDKDLVDLAAQQAHTCPEQHKPIKKLSFRVVALAVLKALRSYLSPTTLSQMRDDRAISTG